jgi:O-antigen/teichoic acid export membrane protein
MKLHTQTSNLLKRSQKVISMPFLHNVFTLMTGTALAQFIPIALSPVLTRIYSPAAFGRLGLYMSVSMILAIAATGRYDESIILPDDDNDSLNIVILCIGVAAIFSLSLLLVLLVFHEKIVSLVKDNDLSVCLQLLPITVIFLALYQSLYSWFNRFKLYKAIALNKISLSISVVTIQLALCKMPEIGLVIGYIVGQAIGAGYSAFQMYTVLKKQSNPIEVSLIQIKKQAQRYIKFAKFSVVGRTMNAVSGNMPIILLQGFYGASFSGFYSLTLRVITLPTSLIGTAIGDVFREAATKQYVAEGQCRNLFLKTFRSLLIIGIIPFFVCCLASPYLFTLFFGEEWLEAGIYARLLSPMVFCNFITIPLCSMFIIAEKQELDLSWQVARMILSISSIWSGYKIYRSDESSVFLFSMVFCILYLVSGIMSYSFSCPNSNQKRIS